MPRRVSWRGRILALIYALSIGTVTMHGGQVLADEACQKRPCPPLTPAWAYEPWVWEDEEHTSAAVLSLVDGYRREGIPVGAVLIDSPWQTNYNTFQFGPAYSDPAALVQELRARGVRVILWATGFVNVTSTDGPERGKAANYDEGHSAGFFVNGGATYRWERGVGSAVDFFNPQAVAWWHGQMDRAFGLGIDGWKVDSPEGDLPQMVSTAAGPKTGRAYSDAYYRTFYAHVAARNSEAIISARPYDRGQAYAPVDTNHAGWVGDQNPGWEDDGLEDALDNILESAQNGYAVVGSDIGGYRPGPRSMRLFMRWTQLGALSPLMENGGRGEHRPWMYGPAVLSTYRYYAKLHHQLVPYLYGAGIEAHRTGVPIIRNVHVGTRQYTLGDDLLVAPLVINRDARDVTFPPASRWHDYWDDDRTFKGPAVIRHSVPIERIPLFIRRGAVIPMQVDDPETGHGGPGSTGHLTLLVYPDEYSIRTLNLDPVRTVTIETRLGRFVGDVVISPGVGPLVLRIKEPALPGDVVVNGTESAPLQALSSWDAFDSSKSGWYYDGSRRYLWVRLAADETGARLTYTRRPESDPDVAPAPHGQ